MPFFPWKVPMLLTDADVIAASDLTAFDGQVLRVSEGASVSVATVLRRAADQCTNTLLSALEAYDWYAGSGSLTSNHIAAVMNGSIVGPARPRANQIVVTPETGDWSPIMEWVAHVAISMIYQASLTNQQVERYGQKAEFYDSLANDRSWPKLMKFGVGIVDAPLSRPAAAREPGSGTWGTDNLSAIAGSVPAGSYKVAVSYVRGSVESHPSELASITLGSTGGIRVSFDSLAPPAGTTTCHVYAGVSTLTRQTAAPVALSDPFDLAALANLGPLGRGQARDRIVFPTQHLARA